MSLVSKKIRKEKRLKQSNANKLNKYYKLDNDECDFDDFIVYDSDEIDV